MPDRDINAIFVENLKSLLDSKKMTYADFANKIGVGASTVSMWMTGKSLPRMELLDKIADLFNIEVADLYFDRSKQGELMALTFADVDLEAGTININKTYHKIDGRQS